MTALNSAPTPIRSTARGTRRRALWAACAAHALHDGLTDLTYVLLPLWQSQFAISYALVGLLRGAYSGSMAGSQLLASRAARRWGRTPLLVGGAALTGLAYLLAGQASSVALLLLALVLGGLGASTQHPLAAALVADSHEAGGKVKEALAQYNFAGDLGKMALPGLAGLLLTALTWPTLARLAGALGLALAALLWWLIPRHTASTTSAAPVAPDRASPPAEHAVKAPVEAASAASGSGGLRALLATGVIDSAVRMGFLTFLPFLLQHKGAGTAGIGLALALLFVGGALGKLACGYLGVRIGMMKTVWLTESATALLILLAIWLPLTALLAVLPLLGVALNGTSSVLYGAVPELVPASRREHAFAQFYTGVIGGGALALVLAGWLSDAAGIAVAVALLAALLLLTLPLSWRVQRDITGGGR